MGQGGLSACSLDGSLDGAEAADPPAYRTSSRGSQMLCEAWPRCGRVVCAAVGKDIFVYNTSSGKKLSTLEGHKSPVTCLLSSGSLLFTGSVDKTVRRWDLDTGKTTAELTGHAGPIWCLALHDDALFSGADDATICRWDAETGKKMASLTKHAGPVRCLLDMDGTLLSFADDGALLCWSLETMDLVSEMRAGSGTSFTCLLTTQAGALFSGSSDGCIRRWDRLNGSVLATWKAHDDWIMCLLLADESLYSGSREGVIKRWDATSGTLITTLATGTISLRRRAGYLAASKDGTVSISLDAEGEKFGKIHNEDGTMSLRTANAKFLSATESGLVEATSRVVGTNERFMLMDNGDGTVSLRTSHGPYVAAAPDGSVKARRLNEGETEEEERFSHCMIDGHYSGVTCMLAVETLLLSGGADRSVKLWDPETGLLLASLDGRTGVTCLLESGGAMYAGAARGAPLRLPRPPPPKKRVSAQSAASTDSDATTSDLRNDGEAE